MSEFNAGEKDFVHGDKFEKHSTITTNFSEIKENIDKGKIVPVARIEHFLDIITDPESELSEEDTKKYKEQLAQLMEKALNDGLLVEESEKKFYKDAIAELTS